MENVKVKGKVELFEMESAWHYVRVPKNISEMFTGKTFRGLVPITERLGGSEWKTSLLPMGDGTHFIALKAQVRKKEEIKLGDDIELEFSLRDY